MKKYLSRMVVFRNPEMLEEFHKWRLPSRLTQMRVAAFVTSFLYILFSKLSQLVAPIEVLPLITLIHLYIVAPLLFCIGVLSFYKKFQNYIDHLLSFVSIIAAIGNLIIVSRVEAYTIYLPEVYLLLFWIFTMSGLRLSNAISTAFLVFVISFVSLFNFVTFSKEIFFMHIFWMSSAMLFGFLTSYFLNRSNKIIFLNKKKLEELAITDELTGLYNRKKLDEVLKNELSRSERFEHKFVFLLLDIDHFKDVNDTFGHQIGDDILIEMTKIIKNNTRSTDIIIRWGGEEFVILFLETDINIALQLAENLRKKVEEYEFKLVGNKTISIGLTLNAKNDTPDNIIKRADDALYRAKNSGRNRVEV